MPSLALTGIGEILSGKRLVQGVSMDLTAGQWLERGESFTRITSTFMVWRVKAFRDECLPVGQVAEWPYSEIVEARKITMDDTVQWLQRFTAGDEAAVNRIVTHV